MNESKAAILALQTFQSYLDRMPKRIVDVYNRDDIDWALEQSIMELKLDNLPKKESNE